MLIYQNLQWHYRYNFFIPNYGALTLFFLSSFIIVALVCLLLKLSLFFFANERRSAFVNKLKPELLSVPTFVFLFSDFKLTDLLFDWKFSSSLLTIFLIKLSSFLSFRSIDWLLWGTFNGWTKDWKKREKRKWQGRS